MTEGTAWLIDDGRFICPACANTVRETWQIGDDRKPLPATCPSCDWPAFADGMGYFA